MNTRRQPPHSARRRAAEPAATIGEASRSSAQTPTNVAEVAQYVAQMTAELSKMATDARLGLLAHLLNMAHAEAQIIVRRAPGTEIAPEKQA
jgi:hypothetical protein